MTLGRMARLFVMGHLDMSHNDFVISVDKRRKFHCFLPEPYSASFLMYYNLQGASCIRAGCAIFRWEFGGRRVYPV
jgi:hypothetical protein